MPGLPPSPQLRRARPARQGEDAPLPLLSRSRQRSVQEGARQLPRGKFLLHGVPRPALLLPENAPESERAQSRGGEKLRRVPPAARLQGALRGDGKGRNALLPVPRRIQAEGGGDGSPWPHSAGRAEPESPLQERKRPLPGMSRGPGEAGVEGPRRRDEGERVPFLPHAPCRQEQGAACRERCGSVLLLQREGEG